MADTKTVPETDVESKTQLAPPWNVIVHDDPITLMTYVTQVFMKVFGYEKARAERHMLEVHNSGKSIVWTGGREQAEMYVAKLRGYYLRATLEQVDS